MSWKSPPASGPTPARTVSSLYRALRRVGAALLVLAGVASLGLGAMGSALRADTVGEGVKIALVSANPFPTLGQPIFVELWIHNSRSSLFVADLGGDCVRNIRLVVTPPGGARRSLELPSSPEGGLAFDCSPALQPGETYGRRLLLNRWLDAWPMGRYQVEISLEGGLQASTAFEVVARDPVRLGEACRALEGEALSLRVDDALEASMAMSFAADEICLPSLVRVLRESVHGKEGAIEGLARLGTNEALAAVAEAWKKLDSGQRSLARFELMKQGRAQALDAALAEAGVNLEKQPLMRRQP